MRRASAVLQTAWLLLGLLGTAGCNGRPSGAGASSKPPLGEEADSVPVTVALVTARSIERRIDIVGTLFGEDEIVVSPKVEGRVARILKDVGDIVRPGDVLLEMEDTEYQLAVEEARKAVEAELAKIGLERLPDGELDVERIPTVARAAAVEENTRLKLERARTLSQEIVSEEDLQARQADFRVARAAHQAVAMEAVATLASARHKLALRDTAEQRLRETKVLAPAPSIVPSADAKTGVPPEFSIAERLVSVGEMTRESPPTPAFRLVSDRVLKLRSPVPERYGARVRTGQKIVLRVESHPGRLFDGTVSRVSPSVDRANRTFPIEARVPNPERALKAGSFAKGSISTNVDDGAPTVPEEALTTFAGVTKVFVVEGGRARAVEVKPGARVETDSGDRKESWYEIAGTSLKANDQVVTSGQSKLVDGSRVRIRGAEGIQSEDESSKGGSRP